MYVGNESTRPDSQHNIQGATQGGVKMESYEMMEMTTCGAVAGVTYQTHRKMSKRGTGGSKGGLLPLSASNIAHNSNCNNNNNLHKTPHSHNNQYSNYNYSNRSSLSPVYTPMTTAPVLYQADLTPPAYLFANKKQSTTSSAASSGTSSNTQNPTSKPGVSSPPMRSQSIEIHAVEQEEDSLKTTPCTTGPAKELNENVRTSTPVITDSFLFLLKMLSGYPKVTLLLSEQKNCPLQYLAHAC